MYLLYIYLAI